MTEVISFKKVILDETFFEVEDILESLREDYDLDVVVTEGEIRILLDELYRYYERKQIQYRFFEMMVGHFEDIACMATEEGVEVNLNYIARKMQLLELLDSPLEVIPKETRMVMNRVLRKVKRGDDSFE